MSKKLMTRQKAIELGLKRYFTGKRCPQNHISERYVSSARCVECGKFYHSRECKERRKYLAKKYNDEHKTEIARSIRKTQEKRKAVRRSNKEERLKKKEIQEQIFSMQKKKTREEKKAKTKLRSKQCQKEYYLKNKEDILENSKKNRFSPVGYKTHARQLLGQKCREDEDGKLEVRCKKCNEWFLPIGCRVRARINAIKGAYSSGSENHLYCSDKCKYECDLYKMNSVPKSLRNIKIRVRCNQAVNRKSLLLIQVDHCGYNFCDKCGLKTEKLEIHHSIMVSTDMGEADNMAHQLLLCEACHKKPEAHCR